MTDDERAAILAGLREASRLWYAKKGIESAQVEVGLRDRYGHDAVDAVLADVEAGRVMLTEETP